VAKNKVLIAGASGLVGFAALRHFSQREDWDVVAVSRRTSFGIDQYRARFIPVDLLNQQQCAEIFGQMSDVTHLVYAAVNEKAGDLIRGWRDRDQMQKNLDMMRNLFEPLSASAKDLRHVSFLQGTKAYGVHLRGNRLPMPYRERYQRHPGDNFYWLQEDYIRGKQAGQKWHWTVFRPQLVIGEAIGSNLNMVAAVGVYAAIRREAGQPLSYPGGPRLVTEMVDVDLIARALHWAGEAGTARNEIFNITNGDVCIWQDVWPAIAESLGMDPGEPQPYSLEREMPKHAAQWAEIVRKYNLKSPADMHAFVGESFALTDGAFLYGGSTESSGLRATLVSTIKLRQAGFHDCIDTEDMFRKWFKRYQELRWLPPAN
jgi:nucleoside-diphosphate-sugar epimerase